MAASVTDRLLWRRRERSPGTVNARTALNERFFDFAILDLQLPTGENTLDLDPEHGKYVFHPALNVTPGTKLLVLTSSPAKDFISDLLTQTEGR